MKKLPYVEGSVFLVPLKSGGFARGVVARCTRRGKVLFGYFFGPRLETSDGATWENLDPSQAILRIRFGDLGLINGEWTILGKVNPWIRKEWPIPDFVRRDLLGKLKPRRVRYADDDPTRVEEEWVVEDDAGLTADSLSGYGAVSIKLTNMLA